MSNKMCEILLATAFFIAALDNCIDRAFKFPSNDFPLFVRHKKTKIFLC